MLEAMFKLLKLEVQVAVAVMTLASGVILWLLRPLVRRMWSALERKPQPQQKQQDRSVAAVAPTVPATVPPVHSPAAPVIVIREPNPVAPVRPAGTAAQSVLGEPDHALYIAISSSVVLAHPRSDDLLDMVDRMGLVALHRDGDPFVTVAPDLSEAAGAMPTPLPAVDPVFAEEARQVQIPRADGAIWVLRSGRLLRLSA